MSSNPNRANGAKGPAQMPVSIEDPAALIGQYCRHNDSGEIYKIEEVGAEGVTAKQCDGFGGTPLPSSPEYLITWKSLKYKHRIMVHLQDIDIKQEHVL